MADSYENTKMPDLPDLSIEPDVIPVDDKGQPLPDPSEFLGSYIAPKSLVELKKAYEAAEEDETIKETMEPVQPTGFFRKHRPGKRGYDYYGTPAGSIPNDSNGLSASPLSQHFTAAEAIDPETAEDENGEEIPFVQQEEEKIDYGKIMTPEQRVFESAEEEYEGYEKLITNQKEIFTKPEVKRDKDAPRIMDLYKDSMNTRVIYQAGAEESGNLGSLSEEEAKELFTEPQKLTKAKKRIAAKEERKALRAKIKLEKKKAKERRKAEKAAAKARKKAEKAAKKAGKPISEPKPAPQNDKPKQQENKKSAQKNAQQAKNNKAAERKEAERKAAEKRAAEKKAAEKKAAEKREEDKRREAMRLEAQKTVEEAKKQLQKEKEELMRRQQEELKVQEQKELEVRKELEEEKSAALKLEEEARLAREEAEKAKAELEEMRAKAENALKQKQAAEEAALAEKKRRQELENDAQTGKDDLPDDEELEELKEEEELEKADGIDDFNEIDEAEELDELEEFDETDDLEEIDEKEETERGTKPVSPERKISEYRPSEFNAKIIDSEKFETPAQIYAKTVGETTEEIKSRIAEMTSRLDNSSGGFRAKFADKPEHNRYESSSSINIDKDESAQDSVSEENDEN